MMEIITHRKKMSSTVYTIIALCHVVSLHAIRLPLQATSALGSHVIKERSNAATGKTVFLKNGNSLRFNLCIRRNTAVTVSNVRYSNDGGSELVKVALDRVEVGSFSTGNRSDWGRLWNVFHLTGQIGRRRILWEGLHVLILKVDVSNGVEIDYVELDISDDSITQEILTCNLMCTNRLPPVPPVNPRVTENATLIQKSYPTECAEEDNVNIPIFLKTVQEYRVTASFPNYRTFINDRHPNTTSCPSLPATYWRIANIVIPQPLRIISRGGVRVDLLFGTNKPFTSQVLQITFRLKGRSRGFIDADIGSKTTIKIKPSRSEVVMRVLYKGRQKKVLGMSDQIFNPGETTKVWHIPDFTWTEFDDNTLFVSIAASNASSITVDYVQLERRYMRPDRTFTIYRSDDIIIEGIDVDFWWRAPETMTVRRLDNGRVFPKVDYFRISRSIPWSSGYAQIFVLYQDGNVRLLELPPRGLDWIPFGTSIIVGQSNPNEFRPSAPVVRMDLTPATLNMTLYYADGGSAKLDLKATMAETVMKVSGLLFKQDTNQHPFATFRSMYVKDGNSDSDSVLVEGKQVNQVMRGWTNLSGRSFMLFRRCESKHLTLSPDIRLDIQQTTSSQAAQNSNTKLWREFLQWRRLMGVH